MKQVDHLYHFTRNFETLEDILKNGLKVSYTEEIFAGRKILIPMISFSNILLRDVGENEVVFYGSYGIGITRQFAIEAGLNPVCYIYDNSNIDKAIFEIHYLNLLPQALAVLKETLIDKGLKVKDNLMFNPTQPYEVMNLINNVTPNTSNTLVNAISELSKKISKNAHELLLLAKPYKVVTAKGEMIAYNEREWRKTYLELPIYFEKKYNGTPNQEYKQMKLKKKPHFNEYPYILKLDLNALSYIIVNNEEEVVKVKELLIVNYGEENLENALNNKLKIDTVSKLIATE